MLVWKIPQNLNKTAFIPKSQLISPCENVTNLACGEVSWPENFQMFSWSSSVISKIQKCLVYWIAKLCLSVLYASLALTNTTPAGTTSNCSGAKRSQVSGEFQHFFSEADDWQVISGPSSVYIKKRSLDISGAPQIWALQNAHSPWVYYLLQSGEQFVLNSRWVVSQWPIPLGKFFLGLLFPSLSLSLTVFGAGFWRNASNCHLWRSVRDFSCSPEKARRSGGQQLCQSREHHWNVADLCVAGTGRSFRKKNCIAAFFWHCIRKREWD